VPHRKTLNLLHKLAGGPGRRAGVQRQIRATGHIPATVQLGTLCADRGPLPAPRRRHRSSAAARVEPAKACGRKPNAGIQVGCRDAARPSWRSSIVARSLRGGAGLEPGPYSRHGESRARIPDQQAQRRPRSRGRSWGRSEPSRLCRIDRAARPILFWHVACPPAFPNLLARFSSRMRSEQRIRAIGMSRRSGRTAPSRRSVNSSRS
jgi:hypothetical protein